MSLTVYHREHFTLQYNELSDTLLPLLREQVFHVTSHDRFSLIAESGHISTNSDGALGNTWDRSAKSFARHRGYVCLLDLCKKSDEVIERGLDDFYFLSPPPLGDDLVFLILSLESYTRLLHWADVASETRPTGIHRIPYIECWHPTHLPLSSIHRVLFVHVLHPSEKATLLASVGLEPRKPTSNLSRVSQMLDDSVSKLYKKPSD